MRDLSSWSLNLHRWWGVQVRLHASFLIFAVVVMYLATRTAAIGWGYGVLTLVVWFASVLAHEIGHSAAAFRLGGNMEQIVVSPWGGLSQAHVAHDPREELAASISGPLVSFVIWLLAGPLVVMAGGNLSGLLSPLHPSGLFDGDSWAVAIKLVFWINGLLALLNVLPAQSLDGLRVLRAAAWLSLDYQRGILVAGRGAQLLAIACCILTWVSHETLDGSLLPSWVPLALLAIWLWFTGKQELSRLDEQNLDEELFSYDFSQGYTSLERHYDGPKRKTGRIRGWLERRRDERRKRQADLERDEERQVDEILARLHEKGLEGLTAKERALLNRVSARFRNRQQS